MTLAAVVRKKTLRFVEAMRRADGRYGRYRYAIDGRQPTLYSSTDAAMTGRLYRDLDSLKTAKDDIRVALERGLAAVRRNQAPDVGFWFLRERPFSYGHPQLASTAMQEAMFPTWFRTLTLAYLGKALPNSLIERVDWPFCNCPGIQFWTE